jgi:hypothetical protein
MPLFAGADPAGASLIDPANTGALPSATYNRSAPSEGLPLARLLQKPSGARIAPSRTEKIRYEI